MRCKTQEWCDKGPRAIWTAREGGEGSGNGRTRFAPGAAASLAQPRSVIHRHQRSFDAAKRGAGRYAVLAIDNDALNKL